MFVDGFWVNVNQLLPLVVTVVINVDGTAFLQLGPYLKSLVANRCDRVPQLYAGAQEAKRVFNSFKCVPDIVGCL